MSLKNWVLSLGVTALLAGCSKGGDTANTPAPSPTIGPRGFVVGPGQLSGQANLKDATVSIPGGWSMSGASTRLLLLSPGTSYSGLSMLSPGGTEILMYRRDLRDGGNADFESEENFVPAGRMIFQSPIKAPGFRGIRTEYERPGYGRPTEHIVRVALVQREAKAYYVLVLRSYSQDLINTHAVEIFDQIWQSIRPNLLATPVDQESRPRGRSRTSRRPRWIA